MIAHLSRTPPSINPIDARLIRTGADPKTQVHGFLPNNNGTLSPFVLPALLFLLTAYLSLFPTDKPLPLLPA